MSALQHAIETPQLGAGSRVRIDGCLAEVLISTQSTKLLRFVHEDTPSKGRNGVSAPAAAKTSLQRPDLGNWLGRSTVCLSDEEIRRRWEDGTFIIVSSSLLGESAAVMAVEAVMASRSDPSVKLALLRKVAIDALQSLIALRGSPGTRDLTPIPADVRRIFALVGDTHPDRGTGKRTARR